MLAKLACNNMDEVVNKNGKNDDPGKVVRIANKGTIKDAIKLTKNVVQAIHQAIDIVDTK